MMKLHWKKICSIALSLSMIASVAAVSAGCSKSSDNSGSSAANTASTANAASTGDASSGAAKLSGSITVGVWTSPALQKSAEQFMKENPGTTVNIETVDGTYTKLYAELAAGQGVPDVVQMSARDVPSFVNKYPDSWVDLTDMLKPEESNFVPFALDLVKSDNKYYAAPWDIGPCGLFYRKDIFQQAGVDPNSLKTYDDYIAAGKKIVSSTGGKTKLLGFDYSGATSSDLLLMLFNQFGGQYYDNTGKVKLNSPEMTQTLSLMKKFITEGVSINLANEWNDRVTAIENNQIATIPYAVWYAGTLEQSAADQSGKWGVVPLPAATKDGNNQTNVGGSALAIYSGSKNADLAKAFIKYALMSSKGNQNNLETSNLFTSYQKNYSDPEYKAVSKYFNTSIGQTFSALSPNIPKQSFGPYFTDVYNVLKSSIEGNVLMKNEDPAKVLDAATEAAQKAIDNE